MQHLERATDPARMVMLAEGWANYQRRRNHIESYVVDGQLPAWAIREIADYMKGHQ